MAGIILIGLYGALAVCLGLFLYQYLFLQVKKILGTAKNKYTGATKINVKAPKIVVARITLEGRIENSAALVEKFIQLSADNSVHAVLLKVNSGGGAVSSSEILHHELLRLNQVKPVIAIVENDCASGAYWMASAASYIIAPKTASIGGIGTIETIKKKVNTTSDDGSYVEVLYTGAYKVLRMSDAPALTDEHRALVQQELDFCYDVFCNDVANARGLDMAKRDIWANGKTFVGQEAFELGLIDALGYPSEAKVIAEKFARERFGDGLIEFCPEWQPAD